MDFPLQAGHTRFQDLHALAHGIFYVFNAVSHRRHFARDLIFDLTEYSQDFCPHLIVPAVLLATTNSSFVGKCTRHILFRPGFTILALYGSVLASRAGLALVTFGLELPTAIAGLSTGTVSTKPRRRPGFLAVGKEGRELNPLRLTWVARSIFLFVPVCVPIGCDLSGLGAAWACP